MAAAAAVSPQSPGRRRRSLGAMLRRGGGSQRGEFAESQPEQPQQPEEPQPALQLQKQPAAEVEPRGGIRGFLRKATSARGLEGGSSRRRLDVTAASEEDNSEQPAAEEGDAKTSSPKGASPQGGGLRGLLRRATSLRGDLSNRKKEPAAVLDLEPVLIITEGNHGKVVFQNLDLEEDHQDEVDNNNHEIVNVSNPNPNTAKCLGMDPHSALHSSLPDLMGLSISSSSRSSSPDSPGNKSSSRARARNNGAMSRSSPDHHHEFILEEMEHAPQAQEKQEQKQSPPPAETTTTTSSPKGITGRLRTFFKRTKSGRTVTEVGPGEGPQIYVPSNDTAITAIASKPSLLEMDNNPIILEEEEEEPQQNQKNASEGQEQPNAIMQGLLNVVEKYDAYEQEERQAYLSTDESSDDEYEEDDYFPEGNNSQYFNESVESFGIYDEIPPEQADGTDALESFMENYYQHDPTKAKAADAAEDNTNTNTFDAGDIQVEPQPAREYDALEIFYEESTFEHVGGSMLLGAASELLTVVECEGEDSTERGEEDTSCNEGNDLLPELEEEDEDESMDESHSSTDSEGR